MKKTAVISECGCYRYNLVREWDETLPRVLWVMLNPSVADHESDDPTIRKCIGFAKRWGFGSIEVVNLYAWRATDPKELNKKDRDIYGPDNKDHWRDALWRAHLVVVAWGANSKESGHDLWVVQQRFMNADCLGLTNGDQPKHPLMLAYDTPREPYARNGRRV